MSIDRERALSSAAVFAVTKGVNVTGWDSFCRFKPENDLLYYYRLKSGPERDVARSLAPEAVFGVRFRSEDRRENIEVLLDANGRALGYSRNLSNSLEVVDQGEEASRILAEETIKARLEAAGVNQAVKLNPGELSVDSGQVRKYTWLWPLPSIPELKLRSLVSIRGNTVIGDKVDAKIDAEYANKYLHSASTLRIVTGILYGLTILIVVIFGVYRFVQRTRQKEISYSRVFLLALILTAVMASFLILTDVATYDTAGIPDMPTPDWINIAIASMIYLLTGLFLGLAYGSGEGDIREAYPGKLSSLDALMTGKFFSGNVARSVVSGWAFGGWMLFCVNVGLLPWLNKPTVGRGFGPLDAWVGRILWLAGFTVWPVDVILIIVIGILIPIPLFYRRFGYSNYTIPFLSIFTWIACCGPYLNFRPYTSLLAVAAVKTFFILIAFFRFDLLTAIIALATPTFVSFSTALMAQPSPSLRASGTMSLSIALLFLVLELFFAFKGRFYREEEVRPVYAKNLAERLSMHAEVRAAREAQQRLMPNDLPATTHFSVAAFCIPAFEVGGDFYDLFEIEPGRLGVLIAEGGGKGLGSALSIAFAKGYLMPKIYSDQSSDNSPGEVIRGLQDKLIMRFGKESNLGILYAVVDTIDGSVRYARTAGHPLILVDQQKPSEKLAHPQEKISRFNSNRSGEEDIQIIEGSFSINPGDSVVFFTDGIDRDWRDNGTSPEVQFGKLLDSSRNGSVQDLRVALSKAINECAKLAKKKGLEDDLTAVVVKVEPKDARC